MIPTAPLPLNHSWSLFDASERLAIPELAPFSFGAFPTPGAVSSIDGMLAARGLGIWECDLSDNCLTWTGGVYDLFGIARGEQVSRALALSLYQPGSRGAMQQLRDHAIRFRRGFTMDAEIRRPDGDVRWMRLSVLPVVESGKAVRLRGVKRDVTVEYDGAPR